MDDKRLSPAKPSEGSERDAQRITQELTNIDALTNPFVAAVRATRMPMIVTNPRLPDNPVVFSNDAFCRLTGYSRDEIVGRNCRFLQGPETDWSAVAKIREAVRAVQSIEIDIRNYRKDGEAFWNRLLLAPVHDASGSLTYFFASQVDVTIERERLAGLETTNAALTAELAGRLHAQRDREQELRFALEAGRLGSWTLDLVTEDLVTSPLCRVNFGRDPESDFTYADLHAAIHPDDRPRIRAAIRRSVETRADYDVQYRVISPAGALRWVGARGRPVYTADGLPLRMSGISLDVTDERRAENMRQALADLGGYISDLQSTADLSFAVGQVVGRTLDVERAGYGTVDATQGTLVVERDWAAPGIASLVGVQPLAAFGAAFDDLRRGETVLVADAASDKRAAGPHLGLGAVEARSAVLLPVIEQGGVVAVIFVHAREARTWHADELGFVKEMAERTRAAIVRRRAEQKLAQLAVSLEHQVAARTTDLMAAEEALRQSQKMEAIGQLTGGVAHDFNNLLTVIRSSVDLMRRPDLPEERRRRYIDAISDTVNRAAKLTGQLLAFARRQALQPEAFDASRRLRDIAEMIDTVTGARVQVKTDMPEEACFVRADVSQFETALVNMAVNARDAMDGAGVLTLALHRVMTIPPIRGHAAAHGRFAAISLTDTGEGIAPDQMARIFEPFYTTKGIGKGTGLGLSQVFGFAKQSGGDVEVSSEPGAGATFTLFLPEVEELAAPLDDDEAPDGGRSVLTGGGRRVLVVEDNLDVGRFSTQVLQDLGYETTLATQAEEALAKLGDEGPAFDVVFSDVVMPGMSGIELAKEIGRRNPGLPVVLTSGYSHVLAEEGSHGFELLHKPYSAEQLSHILRRATRRRRRPPA